MGNAFGQAYISPENVELKLAPPALPAFARNIEISRASVAKLLRTPDVPSAHGWNIETAHPPEPRFREDRSSLSNERPPTACIATVFSRWNLNVSYVRRWTKVSRGVTAKRKNDIKKFSMLCSILALEFLLVDKYRRSVQRWIGDSCRPIESQTNFRLIQINFSPSEIFPVNLNDRIWDF